MENSKVLNVSYNGKDGNVHLCFVSKLPFNVWWPGHQRPLDQREEAYFCSVYSKGKVDIKIEYAEKLKDVTIRPLNKKIDYVIKDNVLQFTIDDFGQYSVEVGDEHNALHLFVNEEVDFDYSGYNIVFENGEYDAGKITLKSGDRVYIGQDAIVKGCFYGENLHDIEICGYGIIDDGNEERVNMHCYENYTNGCLKFYNSENIKIKGVVLVDSAIWIVNLFNCKNVEIDNIKAVGHWRYNTDGIDIVNSSNVVIKNSFIRSFDDTITIKGIVQYSDKDVENLLVDNCVLWCGWGRTLEIGLETVADNYKNLTFTNCDLIHNSCAGIDIQTGDYANLINLTFENIRIEYSANTLPEILQFPYDKEYDGYGRDFVPMLICILNRDYLLDGTDDYSVKYNEGLKKCRLNRKSVISNLKIKDIYALGETTKNIPPAVVVDIKEPYTLETIKLENVNLFGKKVKSKNELSLQGSSIDLIDYKG